MSPSLRSKEIAEKHTALPRRDTGIDIWVMQRCAIAQQIPDRASSTGLLIESAVDHLSDARTDRSTGAHRTGLEGHDKGAVIETPPSDRLGGIAQGHELGVPERVLIDFSSIVTAADHRTITVEDHSPDGNVVMLAGQGSLGEGECHPLLEVRVGTEAELRTPLGQTFLR